MKAETMKERPEYQLFKQNDIVSFFHFQLPRWLIEDSRYMSMGLEAKFTYTLLFNRFQLSKHNGWINGDGEVFIVYTRKELSERMNISEKRVSAAMSELKDYQLIWERRCGRGFANQIYLASVKISLDDAAKSNGGPLDPDGRVVASGGFEVKSNTAGTDNHDNPVDIQKENIYSRTDKTAGLDYSAKDNENTLSFSNKSDYFGDMGDCATKSHDSKPGSGPYSPSHFVMTVQEPANQGFKNRQNGDSRHADLPVQEPRDRLPSILDFRFNDFSFNNPSIYYHSQSESSPYDPSAWANPPAGETDADAINSLLELAELNSLEEGDAAVIRDAIERLYFTQSIRIGAAIYPNDRIRSNLWRINCSVVQDAVYKITQNTTTKIRNSSAYVVTVLFNTIMESNSDLIVDPYLNSLRSRRGVDPVILASLDPDSARMGGG